MNIDSKNELKKYQRIDDNFGSGAKIYKINNLEVLKVFRNILSSSIQDRFNYFKNIAILRGKREEDFAPIKNKDGVDSPKTALKLYMNYWNKK